jgi:hypothetical protein
MDRGYVGMIERGKNLSFALETSHALGVPSECFRQNFDGYITPEFGITGAVNFSHSARTNSGEDFVGAHVGARGQGHLGLDYSSGTLTPSITDAGVALEATSQSDGQTGFEG